ncbi:MAG: FAD-dependent oxidoreductase [Proteobacteria bacterium]|nr:FAD-dependent oxidoreductase [Pseudomonadota bacterium]
MAAAPAQHVAIVGAGALGLTLALRLRQQGHAVTLIEAAGSLGGQVSTWQLGDIIWDRHYHIIAPGDTRLLALLKELGIEDKLHMRPTRTGFFGAGRLHSLSSIVEFMRFPVITLPEKLRLGLTIMRAAAVRRMQAHEAETSLRWLMRWSGNSLVEKLWAPLLQSKFGAQYEQLSAAFIIRTIQRMFGARQSSGQEQFGYVQGGYATILRAWQHRLEELGVNILQSSPVQHVHRHERGFTLALPQHNIEADRVILTLAPPMIPAICPQLTEAEKQRFALPYLGIVCASLLTEKPLSDYYITNILDRWVPFTGVIEMSALVDKAEFGGHSLVYLPRYMPSDSPELRSGDDSKLREEYLSILEKMYPHFNRSQVRAFQVSRLRYVLPLPTSQLQQHPPAMTTSLPGLYTLSTGQVTEGVLTVNKMMTLAEIALTQFPALS